MMTPERVDAIVKAFAKYADMSPNSYNLILDMADEIKRLQSELETQRKISEKERNSATFWKRLADDSAAELHAVRMELTAAHALNAEAVHGAEVVNNELARLRSENERYYAALMEIFSFDWKTQKAWLQTVNSMQNIARRALELDETP